MLIISSIPAFIFIYSDYKSAESFQIYGTILFSLIILIFITIFDMKKLRSIIVLIILNLIFLITPATIFYLCIVYGGEFINNPFREVINSSYIPYVLSYTRTPGIYSWIGPVFFSNIITILMALLEYLNEKENKSKDNI